MNQELIDAFGLQHWSTGTWGIGSQTSVVAFVRCDPDGRWVYTELSGRPNIYGETAEAVLASAALQGRLA